MSYDFSNIYSFLSEMNPLIAVIFIGRLVDAATQQVCTEADIEILGNATVVGTTILSCSGPNRTQQQISQCVMTDLPGILRVSQGCIICTSAILGELSDSCIQACESDKLSATCSSCTANLESSWSSICNSNSSARHFSIWSVLSVLLIGLILI